MFALNKSTFTINDYRSYDFFGGSFYFWLTKIMKIKNNIYEHWDTNFFCKKSSSWKQKPDKQHCHTVGRGEQPEARRCGTQDN